MADLFLVRHGQASFGADNYDQLSPLGERQSAMLGRWLAQCGHAPDLVVTGTLSRQLRTAEVCMAAAEGGPPRETWLSFPALNELETEAILPAFDRRYGQPGALQAELAKAANPRRTFQTLYAAAVARWVTGEHDGDYRLLWRDYRDAVLERFRALTLSPVRSIWLFTSGGPITAIVQSLLAIPDSHAFEVNWALVNTGVTRVRFQAGPPRASLSFLNAYPHLEHALDAALITYR